MSNTGLREFELTGLDIEDPLAYLAALGCLYVIDAARGEAPAPRLRFEAGGTTHPFLRAALDDEENLLSVLESDLERIRGNGGTDEALHDEFLNWSYSDEPDRDEPKKATRDLKPSPRQLRAFGERVLEMTTRENRAVADQLSAVLTDAATDRKGTRSKPFALHFTAGPQHFLQVGYELVKGQPRGQSYAKNAQPVGREDLREAVFGPWRDARALKVFSWSPSQARTYALRALNPSDDLKTGTPGADWLALRSLALLSSAPAGKEIHTGGVRGGWKSGSFTYPVWTHPLSVPAVRSLLRHPDLGGRTRGHRTRTLPAAVTLLTSGIRRSDDHYGSFLPPDRTLP